MSPSDVIFDGFSFNDNGLILTLVDYMQIAQRTNQIDTLANVDGGRLTQSKLGTKPIQIEGYYNGSSIIDAQLMYDILATALNRVERPLIIPHAGTTRTFTATPENVIVQEPDGLNRLTFSFQFVVATGSSSDAGTLTLFSSTNTSASTTIPFTVLGSTIARPFIVLTFTGVTGGTAKTVSIRNARDFTGLTITRNFVSGDVITIDSSNYQVYINSILTEPVGRLPSWAAGAGSLFYSDTFTTRTVGLTGTYTPKRL